MPTPSNNENLDASSPSHSTCPPEDDRSHIWRTAEMDDMRDGESVDIEAIVQQPTPPASESQQILSSTETHSDQEQHLKQIDIDEETPSSGDMMSLVSSPDKSEDSEQTEQALPGNLYSDSCLSRTYEFSNIRLIPSSPSSYLRPGSKFHGTQESERQKYDVQVEIKHVDLRESFLCGYLRIQGLTEDHPTLTTYFEGEIIGSKYSFLTQHEDWGSTDKVDLQHWAKFSAFRPFQKQTKKGNHFIPNLAQCDNIFMRWKEHFLVPDHRVRTISGASFEGFYYICFNQRHGAVSGIYFHAKSEKFQRLELKHVEDRGCFPAIEFR